MLSNIKKIITFISVIVISSISTVCYSGTDLRKFNDNIIGWEVSVPNNWSMEGNPDLSTMYEKAKKALKLENNDTLYDPITVLSSEINQLNTFHAYCTPYIAEAIPNYAKHVKESNLLIVQTLKEKGVSFKHSEFEKTINNIKYLGFSLQLYNKNNQLVMMQESYSKIHKNCDFTIAITYNSDNTKETLYKILNSMKFN